jgi:fibronectin type 3 domain-containing protein
MKSYFRKLLMVVAATAGLGGCASLGPPKPPSLALPLPPSDLRAVRKGNKVYLTWTVPAVTTDRQSVRYLGNTRICREAEAASPAAKVAPSTVSGGTGDAVPSLSAPSSGFSKIQHCETPAGSAAPPPDFLSKKGPAAKKIAASFTDTIPAGLANADPAAQIMYAVEVLNASGRGAGVSNRVQVPLEAMIDPPNLTARISGEGVVLQWAGIAADSDGVPLRHSYRVYRREEGARGSILVQEVNLAATEVVDSNIEWEKTYYYRATVVSRVRDSAPCTKQPSKPGEMKSPNCVEGLAVEGDDSPEVKVFAHDVFPPAVPEGLQAVFAEGFVDLIWAPVGDVDLDGYNVYRREEGGAWVKVNAELVKAPAYRDTGVASGKNYFYAVSAVDLRGNESARSEGTSERVP